MPAQFRRMVLLLCLALLPWATHAQDAASLQRKHGSIGAQLANNPFKRPLALESSESSSRLAGDIYAVIDHPFAEVSQTLQLPSTWCDVLMLHLNTKYCAVAKAGADTSLSVALGRKFDQPLADAQRVKFVWQPVVSSDDYLNVGLAAAEGPLSTRDYKIVLESVPLDGGKSFIHLSYSYAYGTAARLAMQAYLSTIGSDKAGFTVTGKDDKGAPKYIGGVRGVVERNTMRYYLAIDAFLDAPASTQLDSRLGAWFDATERYALQLHETERNDYLAMKRNEYQRMKSGGS
ncbi:MULTISPECIES: hypothetical protein [unclassified Variovorax]|uniref:hypothetical protein n=1 Tax=unclassified Variovorax TaxID=663243 RepID=UPI00210E48F4|nr:MULTISPECIES: hypothetical protein [unclassified Variovorax]